jgi:hypothetical protein
LGENSAAASAANAACRHSAAACCTNCCVRGSEDACDSNALSNALPRWKRAGRGRSYSKRHVRDERAHSIFDMYQRHCRRGTLLSNCS